ncbi:hypothetical protein SNEBB_006621 [Seison nebaliae]|nr:hypothetical protein SNEBB_006621 [Seison nebaliae]
MEDSQENDEEDLYAIDVFDILANISFCPNESNRFQMTDRMNMWICSNNMIILNSFNQDYLENENNMSDWNKYFRTYNHPRNVHYSSPIFTSQRLIDSIPIIEQNFKYKNEKYSKEFFEEIEHFMRIFELSFLYLDQMRYHTNQLKVIDRSLFTFMNMKRNDTKKRMMELSKKRKDIIKKLLELFRYRHHLIETDEYVMKKIPKLFQILKWISTEFLTDFQLNLGEHKSNYYNESFYLICNRNSCGYKSIKIIEIDVEHNLLLVWTMTNELLFIIKNSHNYYTNHSPFQQSIEAMEEKFSSIPQFSTNEQYRLVGEMTIISSDFILMKNVEIKEIKKELIEFDEINQLKNYSIIILILSVNYHLDIFEINSTKFKLIDQLKVNDKLIRLINIDENIQFLSITNNDELMINRYYMERKEIRSQLIDKGNNLEIIDIYEINCDETKQIILLYFNTNNYFLYYHHDGKVKKLSMNNYQMMKCGKIENENSITFISQENINSFSYLYYHQYDIKSGEIKRKSIKLEDPLFEDSYLQHSNFLHRKHFNQVLSFPNIHRRIFKSMKNLNYHFKETDYWFKDKSLDTSNVKMSVMDKRIPKTISSVKLSRNCSFLFVMCRIRRNRRKWGRKITRFYVIPLKTSRKEIHLQLSLTNRINTLKQIDLKREYFLFLFYVITSGYVFNSCRNIFKSFFDFHQIIQKFTNVNLKKFVSKTSRINTPTIERLSVISPKAKVDGSLILKFWEKRKLKRNSPKKEIFGKNVQISPEEISFDIFKLKEKYHFNFKFEIKDDIDLESLKFLNENQLNEIRWLIIQMIYGLPSETMISVDHFIQYLLHGEKIILIKEEENEVVEENEDLLIFLCNLFTSIQVVYLFHQQIRLGDKENVLLIYRHLFAQLLIIKCAQFGNSTSDEELSQFLTRRNMSPISFLINPIPRLSILTNKFPHRRLNEFLSIFHTAHAPELKKFVDKKLLLKLNAGQNVQGVLRGYDPFLNIVLDNTVEVKKNGDEVPIGMVVIRGNSIVMMEAQERIPIH